MSPGLFDRLGKEMQAREKTAGLTMSDVLALPDAERSLFNWMMRREQVVLEEVAEHLRADEAAARDRMAELVAQGFVREIEVRGEVSYRVRLAPKRGRELPVNVWQALDGKVEK